MRTVDHSDNIIVLHDISFSRGSDVVLKNINLTIHRGDYLGIVGGNGAGKSTLIKIILGLLKPTKGTVTLFGDDISTFKSWQRIGYVPQKATSFDPNFPATVFEVVLMGRFGRRGIMHGVTEFDKEKVREALAHVDMAEFSDRLIGDLSGGQQQRVFIARALAGEPEIVFLDEPTVGVAESIKKEFYALLKKMNEDLDLTIVLVTHDMEDMMHEAMHIACVEEGSVIFHERADESLKQSHHGHHHV